MPSLQRRDDPRYLRRRGGGAMAGVDVDSAGPDGVAGAAAFFGFLASLLPRWCFDTGLDPGQQHGTGLGHG